MIETKHLYVFCEGATEQGFCARVLQQSLFPQWDVLVHTLAVGEKNHHHVFGLGRKTKYQRVRKSIWNAIKEHQQTKNVFFTTLFDLYALPDDFPGKAGNARNSADPTPYVVALEKAFHLDVGCHRFIPYLQLHEYETMLFADPDAFRIEFEECEDQIQKLKAIAASQPSIEHIDDGEKTAPSKRIIDVIPAYDERKASVGPIIAEKIGLATIRAKCPHVDSWLVQLENLPWEA